MGAISGVLRFDAAPVAASLAQRIAQRMAHRSPDGIRFHDAGVLALASGALHAAPQSHRDIQPACLPDGALLVADGRIDDRPALADSLGLDRAALAETGDAQLFALAWLRWREDMWRFVLGDYALAIWEPARGQLSLVRDRIGVRPLYWARTPSMLAFASEAEALLGVDGIPAEPNPDRVASNLVPAFDDGDRGATLYRDVRRVMPGEVLEGQEGGRVSLRRYWTFEPLEPLRLGSHAAYVEAFREVFDDAVRVRLLSPATPALMLSGGIDSAAVHASALAQGLPLRRVSVVADQRWAEEERENIEILLAQAPGALRLPIPGVGQVVDLEALVREVFERAHPVCNSIILPMLVDQAAAAAGSRVIVDGIDGDLVTSTPMNYIGRMLRAGHPVAAWREARAAARTHTYLKHRSAPGLFLWAAASSMEPRWLALMRYELADLRGGDAPSQGLLNRDKVASLRLRERILERRKALRTDRSLRDWTGYRRFVWTNPGFIRGLEAFGLVAGRWGIESRHPWCDQRVVDLFLRLPMDVVVRDGWTKHVARAAYAPELGGVAWHSGKQHLGPQVTRTVLQAGRDWIASALADSTGVLSEWMDPGALAAARRAAADSLDDPSTNDRVMEIASLSRWLRGLATTRSA